MDVMLLLNSAHVPDFKFIKLADENLPDLLKKLRPLKSNVFVIVVL